MNEIRDDLKELKEMTLELVKQGVKHNTLLEQHEARSLALQSAQEKLDLRLAPVEDHVKLINVSGKLIGAAVALILIPLLLKVLVGI